MALDQEDVLHIRRTLHGEMGRGHVAGGYVPAGSVDVATIDVQGAHAAPLIVVAARMHGVGALRVIADALSRGDERAFVAAVNAVADIAPERGVAMLLAVHEQEAVTAPDPWDPYFPAPPARRALCASGLVAIDTPASRERALALLETTPLFARKIAPHALARFLGRVRGEVAAVDEARPRALLAHLDVLEAGKKAAPGDDTIGFLTALIDRPALREPFGQQAAEALRYHAVTGDAAAREALAARADDVSVSKYASVTALVSGDPAEVFENLYERYRADREWRFVIADALGPRADPRFIDEAVRVAREDAQAAALTLARIGSARAVEELLQWAERAESYDDDLIPVLESLRKVAPPSDARVTQVFMMWLERIAGSGRERLLLSILRERGSPGDADSIAALAKKSAADADRAGHYDLAVAGIRARHGAL